ncbi:type I-C CRISPR-associated protein Cas8c/Csd1 [Salidesulfovibrio brasiliensis]|uniref:type I-C CRISPR-associated protein Cas8c/Csd1 n=1 Tax=Salidesulfovibrio brasiliensis TaxID=221711 RepID=UPI0006D1F5B1|nr:type I-C CRISPR-associated protein Cas8c/Csd1 [Salidesulfovibrio brasiliensis]
MILQALHQYYERLSADPKIGVSKFGFGRQGVHFCLTLDKDGNLIGAPLDLRDEKGRAKHVEVPGPVVKASGIKSNFAWDNTGYVLGVDSKGNPERTADTHAAFKKLAAKVLSAVDDDGAGALLAFLERWEPEQAEELAGYEELLDQNVVFRLDGDLEFIHERRAFREAWVAHLAGSANSEKAMCLVTGEDSPIPATHAKIKGVPDAHKAGASLVSFNFDAAVSFGKKQNFNAPVSDKAAFAYTTALNYLLDPANERKVQVGDTTVVFWTEAPSGDAAPMFGYALGGKVSEDERLAQRLTGHIKSIAKGGVPEELGDPKTRFYVLGLSPNAARLSVRFWHVGTVGGMVENLSRHFANQELAHNCSFSRYPPIKSLIDALAPFRKDKETGKYKPTERTKSTKERCSKMVNEVLLSVLKGGGYPAQCVNMLLQRIRNDNCIDGFSGFVRLAFLKAHLIQSGQEVPVSLDRNCYNYGYLLGRLFATVESIQRNSAKTELNTTLRDRYFSGAMSSPSRVFVPLVQNAFDNLPKLRKEAGGLYVFFEKLMDEIIDKIEASDGFKHTLSPIEQSQFVIGYFHQRSFKNEDKTEE